jgi:N-methylhydantoinase A/oxoprolinase/acetone carboxylase beta subunit
MAPQVSAFAIASAFAVRNANHEIAARKAVVEVTGKPTTISTELTSALDAPRRALTAVLNARLIGRISVLIAAVERAKVNLGIVCPLMIVKGDGTLAKAQSVVAKPIETVLSGPAASLVGARWLSGLDDFIMSDMGGTTTDIGVLAAGRPLVAEQGAEVGGWRTMVKAIDVKTLGLGGDSEVHLGIDGAITLGPQRVVPISLLGQRYPDVIAMLQADWADADGGSMHGKFVVLPFGAVDSGAIATGLNQHEREVLGRVTDQPQALRKIAMSSGAQRAVASLRKKGLIQYCALTPSDVAHVLNLQDNWSKPAAELAAQLALRFRDMRAETPERLQAFCQSIWSATVALSARAILNTALQISPGPNALLDQLCAGVNVVHRAKISVSPSVPIVAVGGPVKVFYGEVAKRLNCDVVFAPNCDVANAVGAAAGFVAHRVVVTVDGDGNGVFRVHGAGTMASFGSAEAALKHAELAATEKALALALEFGAHEPRTTSTTTKTFLPEARDDNGLLQAIVSVEAIGRPVAR